MGKLAEHRDWNWETDGTLEGLYVETRQVTIKNGPSAGKTKIVFDFHVGLEDEEVSVWETSVIRSEFLKELRNRDKPDFEPGERITIEPAGEKEGAKGSYRAFNITFEFAAPKRTTAELLAAEPKADEPKAVVPDGEVPF